MATYYDAIFKDLLINPKSAVIQALTGMPRGEALPTDAGWYTGRSVDYISKLSNLHFLHVEVQTARNPTMHWRMLNYYTLLQHKLYKWERDDVSIHQFVIYLGKGAFRGRGTHRLIHRKDDVKVIDMDLTEAPTLLQQSQFYADHIVRLLMKGHSKEDWLAVFKAICRMRNGADKLDALFILQTMAGLRNMEHIIEEEIRGASLHDALMNSPLTQRSAVKVAKGEVIVTINRHLVKRGHDALDIDQMELLDNDCFDIEDVRELLDEILAGIKLDQALARFSGMKI
jgi:hypothetical protein